MDRYGEEADRALKLLVVLSRCAESVATLTQEDIEHHSLHVTEFAVLELLFHKGPQPQGEIGRRVLLSSGSVTHVVDKLVAQGFVRRTSCEKDRRRLYAELTEVGRQRIARIFPGHAEAVRDVMAVLTTEEQEALTALLKKLGRSAAERHKQPNANVSPDAGSGPQSAENNA